MAYIREMCPQWNGGTSIREGASNRGITVLRLYVYMAGDNKKNKSYVIIITIGMFIAYDENRKY